ncbi:MAG: helix-turn-helix transcriptional regulator [Bacteroidia bacterium]
MESNREQLNIPEIEEMFVRDTPEGVSLVNNLIRVISGVFFLLEIFETQEMREIQIVFSSIPEMKTQKQAYKRIDTLLHPDDYSWLTVKLKDHNLTGAESFQFFGRIKDPADTENGYAWYLLSLTFLKAKAEEIPGKIVCIGIPTRNIASHERSFESYIRDTSFIRTNREKFLFLTLREKEVLHLLAQGNTNRQTSLYLGISEQTVKTHRKSVVKKLKTSNPMELANYLAFFE